MMMMMMFTMGILYEGYNTLDGFSGGFVFGAGGSGLITPRYGVSPERSGVNTPLMMMPGLQQHSSLTQGTINAAFVDQSGG